MDRLEGIIRARPQLDEVDEQALAQLRLHQRDWLVTSSKKVPTLF